MNTDCTVYLKSFYTKYLLKNGVGLQHRVTVITTQQNMQNICILCAHTGVCFVFINDKEM